MKREWKRRNIMSKKAKSTFDRFLEDPKQRKLFDKEYHEFLLSEIILALMDADHRSVRKLADAAGISPTVIQEIRSGKKQNITLNTFLKLISELGWEIIIENPSDHERIKLKTAI